MWIHRAADDDLRDILNEIEYSWLRAWKGLLLGSPCNAEDRECLLEATVELSAELEKLTNTEVNVDKLEVRTCYTFLSVIRIVIVHDRCVCDFLKKFGKRKKYL